MELIKVLRLRATKATVDERLSMNNTGSVYKGGFTDVRLEIYVETISEPQITPPPGQPITAPISYDEFELKFIKIAKLAISGQAPEPDIVKKYSNSYSRYGDNRTEVLDYIVPDFISRCAYSELISRKYSIKSATNESSTYYQIIQDPWQDEPPLQRNYGVDNYFLNDSTRLAINWYLPGSQSVSYFNQEYSKGLTGGVNYSNNDGSETYNRFLYQPGKTPSIPFVQDESDIQFSKEEKKKISKTIIALNNTRGNQMFVLSSNDIKLFGTSSEPDIFPGNVNDLDIIDKFIGIWKNKVPNYDLKLCEPSYFPSVTNLNFKSPVGTQSSGTPSNDNQAIVKNTPDEVKFKLSIVYDTNIPIKAGQDMPDVNIYVGDPPKEGEFLFDEDEFDDLYLLDDEYREVEFQGEGESIQTLKELADIDEELKKQKESGEVLPPLPPVGEVNPNLPAKSAGGTGGDLRFPLEFNGVPYYAQWDSRWGSDGYSVKNSSGAKIKTCFEDKGVESNLKTSGCGVTSVTMVINFWAKKGKTGGKFTTPREMGDAFSRNGGRVCGAGSAMSDGVKRYLENNFGLTWKFLAEEKLNQALKKGYPVVIGGQQYVGFTPTGTAISKTTSGHYMVATGIDSEGYMRINDPGYKLTSVVAAFANGKVKGGANTPRSVVLIYPKGESAPV